MTQKNSNLILSTKRRDKLYIIAEILEIAKNGALKTQIMYKANLSFAQLNNYLTFILKTQLLMRNREHQKNVYRTTDKGFEFLENYNEISDLLHVETNNLNNGIKIPPVHLFKNVQYKT